MPTVLVIDDEPMVREVCREMLAALGFDTLEAETGGQGLESYRQEGDRIGWVILDLGLPDRDGLDVAAEIGRINPRAKLIIASGRSIEDDLAALLPDGECRVIPKPFGLNDLKAVLA